MSMLTIKHVEKGGQEGIQMVHSVSFNPGDKDTPTSLEAFGCTMQSPAVNPDGYCRYTNGKVYVMNDAGATVGNYDLD